MSVSQKDGEGEIPFILYIFDMQEDQKSTAEDILGELFKQSS